MRVLLTGDVDGEVHGGVDLGGLGSLTRSAIVRLAGLRDC
jgi:hypothetical protein